ncbi:MAG: permease [Thermoguttaceae bacterium]
MSNHITPLFGIILHQSVVQGIRYFIFNAAYIIVLLIPMIYGIGLIRSSLPLERIRVFLTGRNRFLGYLIAALFGAITPFCSCSGVPLFLGFVAAGLPLGIAMSFLISSPMINEAAVVLLGNLVGWKLTIAYVGIGLFAGIFGGFLFDRLGVERFLIRLEPAKKAECSCQCQQKSSSQRKEKGDKSKSADWRKKAGKMTWKERHEFALFEVQSVMKTIWVWLMLGIALGAVLHSAVPNTFFADHLGQNEFWSVPFAVLLGIPTYAGCVGIIPVIGELMNKGLPVGTAFAFMLSAIAISLPELLMLKTVMKVQLLVAFTIYLLVFLTLTGWILNSIC